MVATFLNFGCGILATLPTLDSVAVQPHSSTQNHRFFVASCVKPQANQQLRCIIPCGLRVAGALLSWNMLTHFRSERP